MSSETGIDDQAAPRSSRAPSAVTPVVVGLTLALAVVLAVILSLVLAVIPGLPWWLGPVLGLAGAALLIGLRLAGAYAGLIRALSAVPADPDRYPRFHNVAQGLALAGGVTEPELYVVDSPARNAAAVARGARSGIVATTGLLGAVDLLALEGVVAECLVRISGGDAEASTVGAALFGPLLGTPARPLGVAGLRRLLTPDRDLLADRAAVALTRYPPGLSTALNVMAAGPAAVPGLPVGLGHVWLVPAAAEAGATAPALVETVPLTLRIDVLGEL